MTSFIARTVRASTLSAIDRTLGFVFGLVRGAFIVCLAYLALDFVPPADRPAWIKDARSTQFLQKGADELRGFFPEAFKFKSTAIDDAVHALSPAAEAQRAMRALVRLETPVTTKNSTIICRPAMSSHGSIRRPGNDATARGRHRARRRFPARRRARAR